MTQTLTYKMTLGLTAAVLAACQPSTPPPDTAVDTPSVSTDAPAPRLEPVATKRAFFGDLHIHTKNSFDAYIFGTRATPDDAYRFAKGAVIDNGAGTDIQLYGPPLDFLSVTDHGEYLGIIPSMADRGSKLSKTDTSKSIFGLFAKDRRANFLKIGATVVSGDEIADIYDTEFMNSVWADTVASAERHNNPGVFTTFAGYEFTAMMPVSLGAATNLHRNVIFKNEAPAELFTTLNSPNPEDLWTWMNTQRAKGLEVLSIPHNSNASNGQMFALNTYDGSTLPDGYAANRLRNEPLVEISQVKGTSETHPSLSPNDEWANFEQYEYLIGSTEKSTPDEGSFVRTALGRGLSMEGNPYAFGVIGSTDTHIGASSLTEQNHFGKFSHDLLPENRQSTPPKKAKAWAENQTQKVDLISTPQYGASGLAGVWATENTREALFTSMAAKETFGTSGPRLKVRLFAGDYADIDLGNSDWLETAYAQGVPMGGAYTRPTTQADTPVSFIAWAAQDPDGTPLQRIQIIKVTADAETLYDVACAKGAVPDPVTHRCPDNGAQVDLSTCQVIPDTGSSTLQAIWQDPEFTPKDDSVYYLRVLENPKCRWSTWDAIRNGTPPSPAMENTVQDRAWSSPIWIK